MVEKRGKSQDRNEVDSLSSVINSVNDCNCFNWLMNLEARWGMGEFITFMLALPVCSHRSSWLPVRTSFMAAKPQGTRAKRLRLSMMVRPASR